MPESVYEADRMVSEYLLFHYGTGEQILPDGGPVDALEFPARTARLVERFAAPDRRASALDLGCAVGRAALELTRAFASVLGIDFSRKFVDAAEAMQAAGRLQVGRHEEGPRHTPVFVDVPKGIASDRCAFQQGDACALPDELAGFDAVLAANLVCRLHDPARFLQRAPGLVAPGGVLVLCTPCTWLESFTPRERWLAREDQTTLEGLEAALGAHFDLEHTEDLPFLIREHARKFQWSRSQASVWRRKPD